MFLLMPGGRGPEHLRVDQRCIAIVRHFVENDKPRDMPLPQHPNPGGGSLRVRESRANG